MSAPRIFSVGYTFLSCGTVFTDGFSHAAAQLGVDYQDALWDALDLPARIKNFQPDLLLVTHGRKFTRRWPKLPEQYHSAVFLVDEPYEVDECASWSSKFDHVFINDPATLHRHKNASYLPTCYDPVVHYPHDRPKAFDVGFIGGANPTRNLYLSALAKAGLLTYVIGGPFVPDVQRLSRGHNIPASQTADWYRDTRIVLNVFRSEHHWNRQQIPATSLNPRVYEGTACSGLVVSEWRPEVETVVPMLPTFRGVEECVALVSDLLADPVRAEAIRVQCAAAIAPHTYTARLQTVLQMVATPVAA